MKIDLKLDWHHEEHPNNDEFIVIKLMCDNKIESKIMIPIECFTKGGVETIVNNSK